ncbi:MAG: 4Fe-4S dicluster domain-containing protein [Desulfovibrio sp.]|jgi:ferredoxin|nr:4Fe-4S dicluster domain-containing protein [Desulfovibrio sp.]
MSKTKFLSPGALPQWLSELAAKATVYAPRREGRAVVYRPHIEGEAPELALRPTESAKHVLFPRAEALFSFTKQGEAEKSGRRLEVQEPAEPGPAVIFGALSCDARGFLSFDPVYEGSGTDGEARDPYYLKRREKTALVVRACKRPLSTCFCHWVSGGPASGQGADVLATEIEGGFFLQAFTERGDALLDAPSLAEATAEQRAEADKAHCAADKAMGEIPDLGPAQESLLDLFDSAEFWRDRSAHCLSCGACTYLCPTCYCFNITDESSGLAGVRLRSWDNCMSPQFTLEASGHNPRPGKSARLRNRVGHKFSYYPKIHGGRFSCCGCGRCIKSCPSSVDIRKIVLDAIKEVGHV